MIRKLRKKFILAAVAAVFLVLLLLIGAINVLNFRSLVRDADSTLEILSQNGGRFPGQMFADRDDPAPAEHASPPAGSDGTARPGRDSGYGPERAIRRPARRLRRACVSVPLFHGQF